MKSAKEILVHGLYRDHANLLNISGNSLFLNIPKNNNYVEVLDAVTEIATNGNKDEVLFISLNNNANKSAVMAGYDTIYLYDLLKWNKEEKIYEPNRTISSKYKSVVVQSIDNMSTHTIKLLERLSGHQARLYALYDSMTTKKHLGLEITELIWRFTNYVVVKIGRDKVHTADTLYKLRNNIRLKAFDMHQFITETSNRRPHLEITRLQDLDISSFINPNIPIITPHINYVCELNNKIRDFLNISSDEIDNNFIPGIDEWLSTHEPAIATIKESGEKITLPTGYRFRVVNIIPLGHHIFTVTFEYENINREKYLCDINISAKYLDYLVNNRNDIEITEGIDYGYKVGFGYVLGHWQAMDHIYEKGIVLYNYKWTYDKSELYTCVSCIQQYLNLVIIR